MVNWPTHNTNGHLTKVTAPNGRETEFAVNGLGVRTSRTDAMERPITNGSETVTCRTGDESPACQHETCLRGFMAIPRTRDLFRMPADSSSGASVGARYYDAQVGRFITRDTVLSEHPYLYCEHDAVNWVDPSGHRLIWPVGWRTPPPGWIPPGGGHRSDDWPSPGEFGVGIVFDGGADAIGGVAGAIVGTGHTLVEGEYALGKGLYAIGAFSLSCREVMEHGGDQDFDLPGDVSFESVWARYPEGKMR